MKNRKRALRAYTIAACTAVGAVHAQTTTLESVSVTGKRLQRVSKGATNLPLEIRDTPQTISTIERTELTDFGASGSNDALRLGTGIHVEEYETHRAGYNARGFDVMLTQIDGLGMTNDWGTVVGQLDTFAFERIELIRGANGLLTGVGNASGTINYVRKRPTNQDGAQAIATLGSQGLRRVAADLNRVLAAGGAWAGRLVVAHEDRGSHLRALEDRRSTLYGVVDGQIGDDGMLTLGITHQDARQDSPMWGSLTLRVADGTQAAFPRSSSTSQDWTHWITRSTSAFVEYTHALSSGWDARLTYNHRRGTDDTRLFYAYTFTGTLNPDHTGLVGWPYRGDGRSTSDIVDASLSGRFAAFGRRHEATLGLSHSRQKNFGEYYTTTGPAGPALPAFPYAGDAYPEPTWGARRTGADGDQQITRLYAATRLALGDRLKAVLGLNAIRLQRDGTSIYGGGVALDDETTEKVSPYLGATFDLTPTALAYASYSDIFQAQDQRGVDGRFLAPMKGVNAEVGVKAEWLERRLLTTFALFSAEQQGLATEAGFDPVGQRYWYEPKDVASRGFEFEATGRVGRDTSLTVGFTRLKLTGPDGGDLYEWVPRKTFNLRASTRVLPGLRVGAAARWQSEVRRAGGAAQGAYLLADAFAAWELGPAATLRLNVKNVFDETYLRTVQFGAIYGAPRSVAVSLEYTL